jgi:biopolymer transport protein ExbB
MEIYSIVAFFQKGGLFMYPILLVFVAGMAITVERWVQLSRIRSVNREMWNVLYPLLTKGEFDKAREITNEDKSSISQMLGMGLARQSTVRRREDIEIAMEESMMEIIPQLETRTPYVALLSNIATLLGLLGTIMGLIAAFTAVRQYLGGHEHHGLWADVRDSASPIPCQVNLDYRPDRGQPGDGIGKGAEQYFRFQ